MLFPLDLPGPTALYLSLYLGTLAVHVALMSYVLAGTGHVALSAALGRESPIAAALRDWLPFALGTAITAGVAPLLFLQILYKESFYTANLLLSHRWMAMVPVLIVGFYLLYLAKTERMARRGRLARAAVFLAALACFVFTAWSWTENHLLALDRSAWPTFYAEQRVTYASPELLPRVALWLAAALPLMAVIVGWQLCHAGVTERAPARQLAAIAALGLLASAGLALLHAGALAVPGRAALASRSGSIYLGVAAAGALVQLAAWAAQWVRGRLAPRALFAASLGGLAMVTGVLAVRELMRLAALDTASLAAVHARAAQVGGMPMFLAFLVINLAVIAWAFQMTRRGLRSPG